MTFGKRFIAMLASLFALSLATPAAAAPVWVSCSIRDPGGNSATFRMMFDDQTRAATLILGNGGAHEGSAEISEVEVLASFLPGNAKVDRRTGAVTYWQKARDSQGLVVVGKTWTGSCARSAAPDRKF